MTVEMTAVGGGLEVDVVGHAADDGEYGGGLDLGRALLQHLHQEAEHGQ